MLAVSAPRKLSPDEEAAIISWYAQYQRAIEEIRRLGSIKQVARRFRISRGTVHSIAKREEYNLRRKCRDAGIDLKTIGVT